MIENSLSELKNRNSKISRTAWFIFLTVVVVSVGFVWFSFDQVLDNKQSTEIINELNRFSKRVNLSGFKLNQILIKNQQIEEAEKQEVLSDLKLLDEYFDKLQLSLDGLSVDEASRPETEKLIQDLKKYHINIIGIAELVLDGNKGVTENQTVFKSQLRNDLHAYENILADLRNMALNEVYSSSNISPYINFYFAGFLFLLAGIGFLRILKPLQLSFKLSEESLKSHHFELNNSQSQVNSALELQKEFELKLKTKNAQVIKLQESLEESILKISALSNDKSLIYLNAATDLEGYLKVVNLQKEIIENQTNISQNTSWRPLTSAISQLNSMVGDYFKKSKNGVNTQMQSEVYLSQLIAEIILSSSTSDQSIFEQFTDMPLVKTNVEVLKNVMQPYFQLISSLNESNISVSAQESGAVCEIKWVGLSPNCIKRIVDIDKADLVNLDFAEFKIHMAKNTILERGGKIWTQSDVGKKGALFLRWVL